MAENTHVPDEVYTEFLDTFRVLNKASRPIESKSILHSCLLERKQKENLQLSKREVLKEVFTDILDSLKPDNLDYFEILHGRFWLGRSIPEMLNGNQNLSISDRTFKQLQRDAIFEFASRFLEKEEACKRTSSFVHHIQSWTLTHRLLIIGLTLAVLVSFVIAFLNRSTNSGTNETVAQVVPTSTSVTVSSTLQTTTIEPSNASLSEDSLCGESEAIHFPPTPEFLVRHEGVSSFNSENTPDGILNSFVRSLAIGSKGALIGYNNEGTTGVGGLTYLEFDERKWFWANCNDATLLQDYTVNSIIVDQDERIWVATDGNGVLVYDGLEWTKYTAANSNLPTDTIFSLTIDDENYIWAATLAGVARFAGQEWEAVYTTENEIPFNQTFDIVSDSAKNVWIGHLSDGISVFSSESGNWESHNVDTGDIAGNNIRGIVVREATNTQPESVWFAVDGGGVAKFENGTWTNYGIADGLPSEEVRTITLDYHGRIWIGTVEGTAYFDGFNWHKYHSLNTHNVAFSAGCDNAEHCADDHVWTATESFGLTHSRLPYPQDAVEVTRVCFFSEDRDVECPELIIQDHPHVVTATYSTAVMPGEKFYAEIQVVPQPGYKLDEAKGDMLLHIGENDESYFQSHHNVPVLGLKSAGENFTFSFSDRMFVAPSLPVSEDKASFISPWQVWMRTRLTSPEIHIVFTVEQP